MAYGKSAATGYSDFYKSNSKTPDSNDSETTQVPDNMVAAQKAAIKRRLKLKKASLS